MRKRFFAVMAAALVVSGMPVMAKETSTEEKISGAVGVRILREGQVQHWHLMCMKICREEFH